MRTAYEEPAGSDGTVECAMDSSNAQARIEALTPRGRDVLIGIVEGCSNKTIARKLGISPRTVEIHRARMMRDLGARHIADAIRVAFLGAGAGLNAIFAPPSEPRPAKRAESLGDDRGTHPLDHPTQHLTVRQL